MAIYGITFALKNSIRNVGCSETYYYDAADLAAATAEAGALLLLRLDMLHNEWLVVFSRVSDPAIRGDSVVSYAVNPGSLAGDGTDPWSVLLTRLEATSLYRGRKYLHGCTDNMFTAAGDYNPAGVNNAAVVAFLNHTGSIAYRLKRAGGAYVACTAHMPLRMAEHRIGRPFGLQVGRRRAPAGP